MCIFRSKTSTFLTLNNQNSSDSIPFHRPSLKDSTRWIELFYACAVSRKQDFVSETRLLKSQFCRAFFDTGIFFFFLPHSPVYLAFISLPEISERNHGTMTGDHGHHQVIHVIITLKLYRADCNLDLFPFLRSWFQVLKCLAGGLKNK